MQVGTYISHKYQKFSTSISNFVCAYNKFKIFLVDQKCGWCWLRIEKHKKYKYTSSVNILEENSPCPLNILSQYRYHKLTNRQSKILAICQTSHTFLK